MFCPGDSAQKHRVFTLEEVNLNEINSWVLNKEIERKKSTIKKDKAEDLSYEMKYPRSRAPGYLIRN